MPLQVIYRTHIHIPIEELHEQIYKYEETNLKNYVGDNFEKVAVFKHP